MEQILKMLKKKKSKETKQKEHPPWNLCSLIFLCQLWVMLISVTCLSLSLLLPLYPLKIKKFA